MQISLASQLVAALIIKLANGRPITGKVKTYSGEPFEGVSIAVDGWHNTVTDPQGVYTLDL